MAERQSSLLEDDESLAALRAWEKALGLLVHKLTTVSYTSFVAPSQPIRLRDRRFELAVGHSFAREWIERRCAATIRAALETVLGHAVEVVYTIKPSADRNPTEPEPERTEAAQQPERPTARSRRKAEQDERELEDLHTRMCLPINEKLTFDTFIVDQSNRLAYTAAEQVASEPGRHFNPLFVYGPSGLGKTHLLHSIARRLHEINSGLRIALIDGETFTHYYVRSLREKSFDLFRRYFRSVDVWLVDDIQSIAGKEHTKEEFFHTFNALHQTRRQIVVTSDTTPRELRTMDNRLRTRFEQGLIADVSPPAVETRVAILQRICETEGWAIAEDVLYFIAEAIQSNVRALEGALTRLAVHSSVLGEPVSIDLARSVLTHFYIDKRPVTAKPRLEIDTVIDAVAEAFATTAEAIRSHRRDTPTTRARQIAVYLARELCGDSCRAIGVAFGGRDHTTIQRAAQKIESSLPLDSELRSMVLSLRSRLSR